MSDSNQLNKQKRKQFEISGKDLQEYNQLSSLKSIDLTGNKTETAKITNFLTLKKKQLTKAQRAKLSTLEGKSRSQSLLRLKKPFGKDSDYMTNIKDSLRDMERKKEIPIAKVEDVQRMKSSYDDVIKFCNTYLEKQSGRRFWWFGNKRQGAVLELKSRMEAEKANFEAGISEYIKEDNTFKDDKMVLYNDMILEAGIAKNLDGEDPVPLSNLFGAGPLNKMEAPKPKQEIKVEQNIEMQTINTQKLNIPKDDALDNFEKMLDSIDDQIETSKEKTDNTIVEQTQEEIVEQQEKTAESKVVSEDDKVLEKILSGVNDTTIYGPKDFEKVNKDSDDAYNLLDKSMFKVQKPMIGNKAEDVRFRVNNYIKTSPQLDRIKYETENLKLVVENNGIVFNKEYRTIINDCTKMISTNQNWPFMDQDRQNVENLLHGLNKSYQKDMLLCDALKTQVDTIEEGYDQYDKQNAEIFNYANYLKAKINAIKNRADVFKHIVRSVTQGQLPGQFYDEYVKTNCNNVDVHRFYNPAMSWVWKKQYRGAQ